MNGVVEEGPSPTIDREPYLLSHRLGRWIYDRYVVGHDEKARSVRYERRVTAARWVEGKLVDLPLEPLDRYLPLSGRHASTRASGEARHRSTQPAGRVTPTPSRRAPLGKQFGLLFALDEPMDPLPMALADQIRVEDQTIVRYYDAHGRLLGRGRLARTAEFQGFEDVEVPAGRFERCMRICVTLRIRFPLTPIVNWTSYIWLAPGVGEVKRIQEYEGWVLIFWFGSQHEFLLTAYDKPETVPAIGPSALSGWIRGLAVIEKPIPHSQVEGLVVDFADSGPSP